MSLKIGIVGLPNVGKSTLFNALTKQNADASNYPFCTISPNIGVVSLPDERLEKLAKISKSEKIIPTIIEFVDIAGLVKGAHKGEGLGNQFLSHIREVNAIAHVVRAFEDENVIHIEGSVEEKRDSEIIALELIMADLKTIEQRMSAVKGKTKTGDKDAIKELFALEKIHASLTARPLTHEAFGKEFFGLAEEDLAVLAYLNLFTFKPMIIVRNADEKALSRFKAENESVITLSAKLENELLEMPSDEAKEYLLSIEVKHTGLEQLITSGYKALNLITFFTTGPKETRAWTVQKGAKAPKSAGVIHTDFEKGFIKAEVISYTDFIACGDEAGTREKGLLRLEGKNYEVQDGDIMHFRFSV